MIQERHISVWNNCLNFIQQNIDPKQFDLWFRPIKPVSLAESTLTVEVPSEFFREYLEGAYLELLKASLKKELGAAAKLVYVLINKRLYFGFISCSFIIALCFEVVAHISRCRHPSLASSRPVQRPSTYTRCLPCGRPPTRERCRWRRW